MAVKRNQPERILLRACLDRLKLEPTLGKFWRNPTQRAYLPERQMFKKAGYGEITGTPDILGYTHYGTFVGIEVKASKGRLSPDQKAFIEAAAKSHCVVGVVKSLDELELLIKEMRQ